MLVKFGNNWIQKIPRTAKLDEAVIDQFLSILSNVIDFLFYRFATPGSWTSLSLIKLTLAIERLSLTNDEDC